MKHLIRVPLVVENLNALAGYFTDGPSMMALNGLVAQLEDDAEFVVSRFGFVLEAYEARLSEQLTPGLDAVPKAKQRSSQPGTGYRYADLRAALYLETEIPDDPDYLQTLVNQLERSLNACRFQGGTIAEYVAADKTETHHFKAEPVSDAADWAAFVAANEKPLSNLYLTDHLPTALAGDALIEAYAQALTQQNKLLVCNGYVKVGSVTDSANQTQAIGEPSFTLAEALPVYQLRKMQPAERATAYQRFFWSLDQALHAENNNSFILT